MNKKLHILIIPSWYPEFEGDYLGSFFREQAIGISNHNCKVGIIFPELKSLRGLKKIRLFPKLKTFNDNGLITYKFLWSNWFIKAKYLQIQTFKNLGYLLFKRYIKKNGFPDIIHCQSIFNAGFLGEYIFDKHKIPYIITEHNSGFYYKDQGFERHLISVHRIINKSKQCLSVSRNYSNYLDNIFNTNKKWGVHHNIVSSLFVDAKIKYPIKEKFVFICISRLSKIKNIDLIIKAFKKFNNSVPNSELRVIGIGSEKKKLKQLCQDLKIDQSVKFLGRKLRYQIIEEINLSNVMVYASNFETFGVIFVEALALGRPILSADCGSINEIINKKLGIIIKNNSIENFTNGMKSIYKNYENYKPNKIREYCKENFSETKLSLKLIEEYKKALLLS